MRAGVFLAGLLSLMALSGCAAPSPAITQYLTGFQPPPVELKQAPALALPVIAGLVVAIPQDELVKPTTPSQQTLGGLAQRIQQAVQATPEIVIQRILPSITLPASGLAGLSQDRLQEIAKVANLTKLFVVVPTSTTASKIRFTVVLETQLYVRMEAALVDLTTGRILLTESGQDDYVLAETLYYYGFSYPRLYYRTFTFAGPFTIVDGDPQKALGETAFRGAADQLGMKMRSRLSPGRPAS